MAKRKSACRLTLAQACRAKSRGHHDAAALDEAGISYRESALSHARLWPLNHGEQNAPGQESCGCELEAWCGQCLTLLWSCIIKILPWRFSSSAMFKAILV